MVSVALAKQRETTKVIFKCNACDKRIEVSNVYGDNVIKCGICDMEYKRIDTTNEAQSSAASNGRTVKKAGK